MGVTRERQRGGAATSQRTDFFKKKESSFSEKKIGIFKEKMGFYPLIFFFSFYPL